MSTRCSLKCVKYCELLVGLILIVIISHTSLLVLIDVSAALRLSNLVLMTSSFSIAMWS
jgi:hypothetical protein